MQQTERDTVLTRVVADNIEVGCGIVREKVIDKALEDI